MDIPALIGMALERRQLTQEEFAELIGVSQGTVQKWLAASRRPRPEQWEAIAGAAGVTKAEVSAAVGETNLVRSPTWRRRALDAEAEVSRLQAEVERLRRRARPRAGR